jgi:GWT1
MACYAGVEPNAPAASKPPQPPASSTPGASDGQNRRPWGEAMRWRRRWAASGPLAGWLVRTAALNAVLWAAWHAAAMLEPVSRRSCNAAYVLWALASNLQVLLGCAAVDALAPQPQHALLLAMSSNMLPLFLLVSTTHHQISVLAAFVCGNCGLANWGAGHRCSGSQPGQTDSGGVSAVLCVAPL